MRLAEIPRTVTRQVRPRLPGRGDERWLSEKSQKAPGISRIAQVKRLPAHRLYVIGERYFKEYFALHPDLASEIGISGYEDRLPEYSAHTHARELARTRKAMEEIQTVSEKGFSPDEKFDRILFLRWLEHHVRELDDKEYEKRPALYGTEAVEGIFSQMLLSSRSDREELKSLTAKISQLPRLVREGMKNLTSGTPKLWAEIEAETLPSSVEFLQRLPQRYRAVIEKEPQLGVGLNAAIQAAGKILNDYERFLRKQLIPAAQGEFAIGRDRLAYELKTSFWISDSPEALSAWARQAARETRQKMEEVARRIDPAKAPRTILDELSDEHPDPARIIDSYRQETRRARQFIRDRDLMTLPREDALEVTATPTFLAHDIPTAAYYPPRIFGSRPRSAFLATLPPSDLPSEEFQERLGIHNPYDVRSTAVHEAYPGHHVQMFRAREVPESRLRHILGAIMDNDLKVEGWGLYSEQLMVEAGFLNSPKDELLRLSWLLRRQVRLWLGIGLHTEALTRQQAVEEFVKEVGMPRSVAEDEVNYFTMLPLQPLSYALGHREIIELREALKKQLGPRFSLKKFHDALLDTGNLPIGLVREWIEQEMIRS